MTQHSHQTAPTQFVDAAGVRFAYQRFGKSGGVPLIFNMHFTGTMDHWNPAVTDGFAKDREVILFDNAGISGMSGEVPTSVEEMAANAIAFIRALGFGQVNMLGFLLGGLIAQEIALAAPALVRRLVLVGTAPRSGEGMSTLTPEAQAVFGAAYENPDDLWLGVFFTPSKRSQAAGLDSLKRFRHRTEGRNSEVSDKVAPAQIEALGKWGGTPRQRVRPSEGDHPTDAGPQWRQRRHRLHGELVHLAAAPPERAAHPLPRCQSRLAVPVPRSLRPPRLDIPRRIAGGPPLANAARYEP
ncbi:MAG: alpha/beta hydrolase [Rhodospirillales bacterium]|jgi:pimeloyl-ACP methyl ester carboxylesterase|nr:alpha/beta hydrolase [Rhodospirillales bacterium]